MTTRDLLTLTRHAFTGKNLAGFLFFLMGLVLIPLWIVVLWSFVE